MQSLGIFADAAAVAEEGLDVVVAAAAAGTFVDVALDRQ